jgi:hypothetical protein
MYWGDYFTNLRMEEYRSTNEGILENHPEVSKFLRAHFIDWVFHVWTCLNKEDENIPI